MDEMAGAWSRNELGMSFVDAFAARGFDFRSQVSSIAMGLLKVARLRQAVDAARSVTVVGRVVPPSRAERKRSRRM